MKRRFRLRSGTLHASTAAATARNSLKSEAVLIVLGIDPGREPARAWRAYETHMARARWMTEHGYEQLLRAAYH